MKIPVGIRHMKALLFFTISVLFLLATFYNKVLREKNSRAAYIVAGTREVLSALNSKINEVILANETDLSANSETPSMERQENKPTLPMTHLPAVAEKDAIIIDRRVAEEISNKIRLLCWIPSREKYMNTRLKAVNTTWVRRCDKTLYFITNPINKSHDVVGIDIPDMRQTLTDKTVFAHKYIYDHYLDRYDWFLKADDDTYVIVENLKFLLSHFNLTTPGYIGCQFKHFAPQGYMSGGAGYAFNALGIKQIVEKGYQIPGRCRLKGGAEDIETGRCAFKAGIPTLNQLDVQAKQTFFPSNVYANLMAPIPSWVAGYMRATVHAGLSCCSPLLVSFHYTGEKLMYAMEFLLYRVVVHGRNERGDKAAELFEGLTAPNMDLKMRRRPYPGEKLEEYYQKGWREKNTTIYINPNL